MLRVGEIAESSDVFVILSVKTSPFWVMFFDLARHFYLLTIRSEKRIEASFFVVEIGWCLAV